MVPVALHPMEDDVSTVERAEICTVARSAPALRDKPDASGDVFAVVFDSARRSMGSLNNKTTAERQACAADEKKKSATAGNAEAATAGEQKNKGLNGHEALKENQQAPRPEPVMKQKADQDEPEQVEPGQADPGQVGLEQAEPPQPGPGEKPPQVAETGAVGQVQEPVADQTPVNQAAIQPEPLPQSQVQIDPMEDLPWESLLRVSEVPVEAPSPATRPADSTTMKTHARPAVSTALSPVVAEILQVAATGQASESCSDECAVPQAADNVTVQVPSETVAAEQAAQPICGENIQKNQELPISVWQFLRGVAAHLEQVVEAQDRASGNKQPGARLQQAVEGRPAADQMPDSRMTKALLAGGLASGGPTHKQLPGQDENRPRGEGASSQASSGDAAKSTDGSAQQTGANDEFRGLLELAGRVRERIGSPDLPSAAVSIGRDLGGKGVSLNEARAMTDLANVVRANIGARHSSMVLRLDPPELGQLRVDVRVHGDELTLRLQADTLLGRDVLQSRLSELRSSLEQHGFKLSQIQVELRVPQGTPAESHQDRPSQHQERWDGQASHDPGWQGHAGGGSETSSQSEWTSEGSAFSQEDAWFGEEQDHVDRLAETGVDLVV